MKKIHIYICLMLFASSCEKNSVLDSQDMQKNGNIVTRSNAEYSLFRNVIQYNSASSASITGDIYCSQKAEYTFTFSFVGSPGTRYFAHVGGQSLHPSNGSTFRTVTTELDPGINSVDIEVNFSGANQRAEVRLVIEKINGVPLYNEQGIVDLALGAFSGLVDLGGGSESYHWMCSGCRALNSLSSNTCVSCGHGSD